MRDSIALQIYASAFSKMSELLYLLDKDGFLIDCSHNLLRFLGFDRIENNSIGAIYEMMRKEGLWTSQQIQNFQQHDIDVMLDGKSSTEEQAIINNSGSILYFEISRTPLADKSGNALGLLVVLRDLTKQKQLNTQLRSAKSQLRYSHKLNVSSSHAAINKQINALKILLIEDNVIAQKAEKTVLMSCRCMTDVVATPRQADEIFKPGKYDLVLMDLTLEEGDGYQLTATLRKREQGSNYRVPIIALTGHDPTVVGFNCEDAEMDGILRKPLTVEQANQLIQRYIRHVDVNVKGLREFKQ
ncbi:MULTISPECIES: response regulator [Legionella]|nr:response regulator [Legionella maceachernii]